MTVVDVEAVRLARANLRAIAAAYPSMIGPQREANVDGWEVDLEENEAMARDNENNDTQIVFRLPQSLLDRLDAYADKQRDSLPGSKFSRADALRVLISKGLEAAEAGAPKRKR